MAVLGPAFAVTARGGSGADRTSDPGAGLRRAPHRVGRAPASVGRAPVGVGGGPVRVGGGSLPVGDGSLSVADASRSVDRPALYLDGPPPGHTGGFGEPDCTACHFDAPVNAATGSLRIAGLPESYVPGERYDLGVTLEASGAARGGFQLSARFGTGERRGVGAGGLGPGDTTVQIVRGEPGEGKGDPRVAYAEHTRAGTGAAARAGPGRYRWTIRWTAPESAAGPVVFHAAANAANDDASEFGDRIFTLEVRLPPVPTVRTRRRPPP